MGDYWCVPVPIRDQTCSSVSSHKWGTSRINCLFGYNRKIILFQSSGHAEIPQVYYWTCLVRKVLVLYCVFVYTLVHVY